MTTSLLAGCGLTEINDAIPDQRLAYKKQREAGENLELPPDLIGSRFDDALDIPPAGAATLSEYRGNQAQRQRTAATAGGEVLPETANAQLKRQGETRWLELQATPQQTWSRLIAFWREQGILLVEQNPAVGVMRTDWLDNRAEIRRDFVTRMISKVAEGVYATSTRDQYSLRVEKGTAPGITEVHLTHRGMEEKLVTNTLGDANRTVWEPSGSDPEKEAEMLRRILVWLGGPEARQDGARTGTAAARPSAAGAAAPRADQGPQPRLVKDGAQESILIAEEFRRAWRTTGSALGRAGFAVEDRDQSRGLFYVRYAGQGETQESEKPGLLSRMAFWRGKEALDTVKKYQIRVEGNDSESRVTVLTETGQPAPAASASTILTLLHEQMR